MKFVASYCAVVLCLAAGRAVLHGTPASASLTRAIAPPSDWPTDALGGISPRVLNLALNATRCAIRSGDIAAVPPTLTVIDYSKPSTTERLWVFDLQTRALLYHELVAHGQGSGGNVASRFSNNDESHESSLGLYLTEETYVGKNGYSLRLKGLDTGFNDRAHERAIVMHGAPYVNEEFARRTGRLGRSWGCPALRVPIAHRVIDRVKGGGAVFAYGDDPEWLHTSKFLNDCDSPAPIRSLNTF